MPNLSPKDDIAASIERTLAQETRRNELRIAGVRVVAVGLANVLDWLGYLHPPSGLGFPPFTLRIPLLTSFWFVVALAVAFQLRRGWYRSFLPRVTPFLDAMIVGSTFLNVQEVVGGPVFAKLLLPGLSVCCGLLAMSGGFRFDRGVAAMTTVFAVAICDGLALRCGSVPGVLLYVTAFLIAAGAMGYGAGQLVRGILEGEIARSTFERFLPDSVMRGAYGDPLSLVAEPKIVEATVLVSDLRGFTALSEKLSPVEVLEFLNEIQGELARAVGANGGTVDKFMGDGMLAVFGAPQPLPDHAARAVQAARDIRAAVVRVNAQRAARGLAPFAVGMGIHSGPVVTGCLGSGARLEFTVLGDTVNTASRLESMTKEKHVDVLVSAETVARAASPASFSSLGEVALRGRREPLGVHALAA